MPSKRTSVMGSDPSQTQQQPPPQPSQPQTREKARGSLDGSSSGSSSEDDDDDVDDEEDDEDSLAPRHHTTQQPVIPNVSVAMGVTGSVGTPERTHRLVDSRFYTANQIRSVR